MNCPEPVSEPILEILKCGLLNLRYYAGRGDSVRCSAEANHLHNLPSLLRSYSPESLDFYLDVEQPEFVADTNGVNIAPFEANWEQLRTFRSNCGRGK